MEVRVGGVAAIAARRIRRQGRQMGAGPQLASTLLSCTCMLATACHVSGTNSHEACLQQVLSAAPAGMF